MSCFALFFGHNDRLTMKPPRISLKLSVEKCGAIAAEWRREVSRHRPPSAVKKCVAVSSRSTSPLPVLCREVSRHRRLLVSRSMSPPPPSRVQMCAAVSRREGFCLFNHTRIQSIETMVTYIMSAAHAMAAHCKLPFPLRQSYPRKIRCAPWRRAKERTKEGVTIP